MMNSDSTWLIALTAGSALVLLAVIARLFVIAGHDARAYRYNREIDPTTPPHQRPRIVSQAVRLGFTPARVWIFYWLVIISSLAVLATAGSWLLPQAEGVEAVALLRLYAPLVALVAMLIAGVLYAVALEWRKSMNRGWRVSIGERLLFAAWAIPLLLVFIALLVAAFSLFTYQTLTASGAEGGFLAAATYAARQLLDIVPLGLGDLLGGETLHTPAMDERLFALALLAYKFAIVAVLAGILTRILNIFFFARPMMTAASGR